MTTACLNCGTSLSGRYCTQCGQREIADADRGLAHLLGDFFTELTSLESRTWRSLSNLLVRPGELSRTYLTGARQRYLKPISLFLLVNLAYFLAPPLNDFNLPMVYQARQPWRQVIIPMIEREASERAAQGRLNPAADHLGDRPLPGFAAAADDYAARSGDVSKLLIIAHVPFLAFGLMLAFAFRRFWYAEHFVVALHVFAWLMALPMLLSLFAHGLQALGVKVGAIPFKVAALVLLCAYTAAAARRAYAVTWKRALLVVAIALPVLFIGHFVYRFLQGMLVFALI